MANRYTFTEICTSSANKVPARARARASWRRRQEIQLYIPERSRSWPGDRKALFTARITIREEVLGGGREV